MGGMSGMGITSSLGFKIPHKLAKQHKYFNYKVVFGLKSCVFMLLDMPFDLRKMSSFVAFKGQKNQKQLSFLNGMKWRVFARKDPGVVAPLPDNHIYIY